MPDSAEHRMLLTRYLLGQVSPEERAGLEGQYLDDDALFHELIAAENDLIDDYVRGKLGPQEKPFEEGFLSSPERRERVEFAKSLLAYRRIGANSDAPARERPSRWEAIRSYLGDAPAGVRLALATLLLLTVAGSSWLAVVNGRLYNQIEAALKTQAQAQRQTQELRRQIRELQQSEATTPRLSEAPPAAGYATLSMTLAPGLTRGADQRENLLAVPRGISEVRLWLKTNGSIRSTYNVILETAEGVQVWKSTGLAGHRGAGGGSMITIQIPAKVLKGDDYVLRLFLAGSSSISEEYSFRVVK